MRIGDFSYLSTSYQLSDTGSSYFCFIHVARLEVDMIEATRLLIVIAYCIMSHSTHSHFFKRPKKGYAPPSIWGLFYFNMGGGASLVES